MLQYSVTFISVPFLEWCEYRYLDIRVQYKRIQDKKGDFIKILWQFCAELIDQQILHTVCTTAKIKCSFQCNNFYLAIWQEIYRLLKSGGWGGEDRFSALCYGTLRPGRPQGCKHKLLQDSPPPCPVSTEAKGLEDPPWSESWAALLESRVSFETFSIQNNRNWNRN